MLPLTTNDEKMGWQCKWSWRHNGKMISEIKGEFTKFSYKQWRILGGVGLCSPPPAQMPDQSI